MRIDSQGQITIPSEIQEQLGLEPGTEVQLEVSNSALLIRPVRPARSGMELIESLRGKASAQFSTDQTMDLTRGDS